LGHFHNHIHKIIMSRFIKPQMKAKRANKNNNNTESKDSLPQFNSTIQVSRKVRYESAGVGQSGELVNFGLTRAMLLNHLVVNTAANANARIISGYKLNRITARTQTQGGLGVGNATISVEWTSTYGPTKIVSDTSMSIHPAKISTRPPKQSLASFWSLTGSNETDVLAILNFPAGTVIDIDYTIILQDGETPVSVASTAAGTVGTLYMLPLDGSASGQIVPVSYKTII
jgi:hypothetical protein